MTDQERAAHAKVSALGEAVEAVLLDALAKYPDSARARIVEQLQAGATVVVQVELPQLEVVGALKHGGETVTLFQVITQEDVDMSAWN